MSSSGSGSPYVITQANPNRLSAGRSVATSLSAIIRNSSALHTTTITSHTMLLTKPLTTLLSSSLSSPVSTLLLLTPTGHILSAASALPSSVLRARATLALQIWGLYASNPSALSDALPSTSTNPENLETTDDDTSEKPPAVASVAVHLSAGTLVIRQLNCGLLVCGLSNPPAESETPAHAGTPTGSQRGARPNYQAQHFLAPGSPLEGVASSAVSDAGSVGTVGRRGNRELAILRKRVEEVGRWLDEELGGFAMSEGI
ncbi:hypothetical protein O988_08969 [Pseudogymnoascus sp. VKM F-3808]|nr:hypothetical protein O988_08969 [Pseudogymnoascus sp. VKM F-3808]